MGAMTTRRTVFDALADETRRQLLELLAGGERTAGDLASNFPIARPTVSRHLRVLREAGLVRWRGQAQRRLYRVDSQAFDEVIDWLERMRRAWSERLDHLEKHLHETRKDQAMKIGYDRLGEISNAVDGTLTLRFERRLSHPPERVWAALTETEELGRWFMAGTVEPHVGGRVRFESGEEGGTEGEVLAWDPPRLLEYSWVRGGDAGPRSLVRWRLTPDGDGTVLVLQHEGVARETAFDLGAGWHDFLDRLPRQLAGEDASDWTGRYAVLLDRYRALA